MSSKRPMSSTIASVEIAAPAGEVFDLIHDYERRLEWDPFLRRAELLEGAGEAAVGVSTYCAARWGVGGLGMETVYVRFDRPGVAAVKMTRGPWFLRSFAASILQQPIADGRTRVSYKSTFRARPKWAAPLLEWIFRRVFLVETRSRLAHLKRFVESAQLVEPLEEE